MLIFELISQYESICRMAMRGCAAKLLKSLRTNIIEILFFYGHTQKNLFPAARAQCQAGDTHPG